MNGSDRINISHFSRKHVPSGSAEYLHFLIGIS